MSEAPGDGARGKSGRTFSWRRLNMALHRDIGYLVAALTIIYAVSGVAVNHIHHWNPSYRISNERVEFEPFDVSDKDTMVAALVERLDLPGPPNESFRPSPEEVHLFYERITVEARATEGVARVETTRDRPVFRDANFLHLNQGKGLWTILADVYAVLLGTLAISGLFILRGKKGFGGRGKWLFAIGTVIPLVYLVFARYVS
jgi:hypothetical protein